MRFVGYVVGFLLLVMGILAGGRLQTFAEIYTLVIVFGGAFAFAFAAHGTQVWGGMKAAVLDMDVSPTEAKALIRVLRTLRGTLLGTGAACFLMGAINMSMEGSPKDLSWFGPAFAVDLLSLFYAVVVSELVVAPAMARWQSKLD